MKSVRYIENESHKEVVVDAIFTWGSDSPTMLVTYSSGRRYAIGDREFCLHFSIVTPQHVEVFGYGGIDDRPTKKQRELQEREQEAE